VGSSSVVGVASSLSLVVVAAGAAEAAIALASVLGR
jgi:hypothetical protein